MKKTILSTIIAALAIFGASASAAQTDMYVNNTYVSREFTTIGQFDMVPILDIAGELGYSCSIDDQKFQISNGVTTFYFTIGSADVYAQDGVWFGLDIVPTIINGRVMIPSNFLIYNMGVAYSWDDITSTLFINSDYTYKWLINTPEYRQEKTRRKEEAARKEKEAQQAQELEKNKAAVSKFYVGQRVYQNVVFTYTRYGRVTAIDAANGKVQVNWEKTVDNSGNIIHNWLLGTEGTYWEKATDIYF